MDDQTGPPQGERVLICVGADRATGRDDADPLDLRMLQGCVHTGFDDSDDRYAVFFTQTRQGVSGGGVASHDNRLHAASNEKPGVLIGKVPDRLRTLRSIRQPGGVPEIKNVLVRQKFLHRPHHGQAADTRVKKSKRR